MKTTPWLVLACAMLAATSAAAQQASVPLLDPLFSDHAVLQRDKPVRLWGSAAAGDRVTVQLNGRSASAVADGAGHWMAALPAMPAGGPYSISVQAGSGAAATASDILVGDVWLCSGQSNMEWGVGFTTGGADEVAHSATDSVRLLTIAHNNSLTPLAAFDPVPAWQVAAPATVRPFSAACWYFARELQQTVHVPMGLINSSWGGSAIQPWISERGLRAVGGLDGFLDMLALRRTDPAEANRRFGAAWEAWWRGKAPAGSAPWLDTTGDAWRDVPEPMRDYKTWGVAELARHDGMMWYRRAVTLTAAQAAQAASLSLGAIDEVDETWVNGAPIGNTFGYGTARTYPLAAGTLRAGENVVLVNVLNTWAAGGMTGPADQVKLTFADGSVVPLGGQWRWQMAPESMGSPPRSPWEAVGGLTVIGNAMIAPLGPFGLRGALWYQGESNTSSPSSYQALLSGLMADWRHQFGAGLPFLVVQLPNFGAIPTGPVESGWAQLREAQRRAVAADAHAGLAVTIDVGVPENLHPPDKKSVGKRLARAARHVVYGERIAPSGPRPRDARRNGPSIVVRFSDVEGALATADGAAPLGFELCRADQASCRWVTATADGQAVSLDASSVSAATRVRYCWGDAPRCNLRDASGLPAGPFEIAVR